MVTACSKFSKLASDTWPLSFYRVLLAAGVGADQKMMGKESTKQLQRGWRFCLFLPSKKLCVVLPN